MRPDVVYVMSEEGRTSDILLENIKLLQNVVEQRLRVLVHDEDLPFLRRIHRPDRVQEFYTQYFSSASFGI